MSTAYIDGDVLVYQFAHGAQKVIQWDRDLFTFHAELAPTTEQLDDFVQEILEKTQCMEAEFVLSDLDRNYRKEETNVDYKATRAGVVRPILFKPLRQYMIDEWDARWEPRLEGDDMLGLLADPEQGDVICTIDKDLLGVPGYHFNWNGDEHTREVHEEEAEAHFLTQCLAGDPTDSLKGVPGLGMIRAGRMMASADLSTAWEEVVIPAYQKAGLGKQVALDTARCVRVLRGEEYDFETGEVQLWAPSTR